MSEPDSDKGGGCLWMFVGGCIVVLAAGIWVGYWLCKNLAQNL